MQFHYFEPAPQLREYVSSYYYVYLSSAFSDVMRAEIANIRFILKGRVDSDLSGEKVSFGVGDALLCGPTYHWSNIHFAEDTKVFGAAITPLGWRVMFDMSAEEAADKHVTLMDIVPSSTKSLIEKIFSVEGLPQVVQATDSLFLSLVNNDKRIDTDFVTQATDWIVDPEPNEIEHLLDHIDISHRQVERLCKLYFGSGPKKLHRKFRALHAANRLTWQNLDDWREVARTAYYDQAHFIREFKQFNGRTPKEFMNGPNILVRITLQERLKINHASPFSLVG